MSTTKKTKTQAPATIETVSKKFQNALKANEIAEVGDYVEVEKDGFNIIITTADGYKLELSVVNWTDNDTGKASHFIGTSLKLPKDKVKRTKF